MNATLLHSFNGKLIEFEMSPNGLMVNATEMANIYSKKVSHFLENDGTENFINSCIKSRNSDFLAIENREDLVFGKQKSGTWMHRALALKFAAWLDSDFEVWVFSTINEIVFKDYQEMKESNRRIADLEVQIDAEKEKLSTDPHQIAIEKLENQRKLEVSHRNSLNRDQTALFKEEFN